LYKDDGMIKAPNSTKYKNLLKQFNTPKSKTPAKKRHASEPKQEVKVPKEARPSLPATVKSDDEEFVDAPQVAVGKGLKRIGKFTVHKKVKGGAVRFSGEMHLPGHNFTGPGTRTDIRLDSNGNPQPWSKPINKIDWVSLDHDRCYIKHTNTRDRNIHCDPAMVNQLDNLTDLTFREKLERPLARNIIAAKAKLGLGLQGKSKFKKT